MPGPQLLSPSAQHARPCQARVAPAGSGEGGGEGGGGEGAWRRWFVAVAMAVVAEEARAAGESRHQPQAANRASGGRAAERRVASLHQPAGR